MNFELILEEIGVMGLWQSVICIALWIPPFFAGVHVLMFSFTGLAPTNGYRCKINQCDSDNFKFDDYPEDIFYRNNDEIDYCQVKKPLKLEDGSCIFNSTDYIRCGESDELSNEYAFAPFEFESTLVTEWSMYCGVEATKVAWIGSAYMFGLLIGSYVSGVMSDKYGRKVGLLFSILLSSTASLVGAFMPEYYSYLVLRIITALGEKGLSMIAFTLTLEIIGTRTVSFIPWPIQYKTIAGTMIQAPFAIGMAVFSWYASFLSKWRTLQWTASVAAFGQLIVWYCIPESPRWLLAKNKNEEAKKVILSAAKWNGVKNFKFQIDDKDKDESTDNTKVLKEQLASEYTFKDIFHPSIRYISLIWMLCWPIVTLGYYGITFSMAGLNDDLYISFILSSLVEIPSYIVAVLLMDLWGRKPLFSISLLASGGSCIACGFLDKSVLRTVLAMCGKLFASGSFAIMYMYTAELYPTVIRSSGIGLCSLIARIGGIAAPQIAINLPKVAGIASPYYVMGGASVVGGLLSLYLPETLGSKLPETMHDVDIIKANSLPFWRCATLPRKKEVKESA